MAVRVLFASPEISPWVKTGGLGDVTAALPPALARGGCEVRLLLPGYPALMAGLAGRARLAELPPPGGDLPASTLWKAPLADGVTAWLLEAPSCFERPGNPYLGPDGRDWPDNARRFGLLSRVAAWLASPDSPLEWAPDVLHVHDWQTALAPAFQRYLHGGRGARTVVTIHNLSFFGLFGREALQAVGLPEHAFALDGVEYHGWLSFLKAGLQCCDRITTVSPTYASEILEPALGYGMEGLLRHRADRLSGILNGIDTDDWNPATDRHLVAHYDASTLPRKRRNKRVLQAQMGLEPDDSPLLGAISRLTEQKGLDLLLAIADALVGEGAQIALLGSGEAALEEGWRALAARHPGRCAAVIGFDEALAHRIEAGADVFVMPSRFEPCGLNQMYSLRYGTPPVVRRTGGLADTVVDATDDALAQGRATGFVFDHADATGLRWAVDRALALHRNRRAWPRLQRAGMALDFGWARAAAQYADLYRTMLA